MAPKSEIILGELVQEHVVAMVLALHQVVDAASEEVYTLWWTGANISFVRSIGAHFSPNGVETGSKISVSLLGLRMQRG